MKLTIPAHVTIFKYNLTPIVFSIYTFSFIFPSAANNINKDFIDIFLELEVPIKGIYAKKQLIFNVYTSSHESGPNCVIAKNAHLMLL